MKKDFVSELRHHGRKFEYISVAAHLLQEPRYYKLQLYTDYSAFDVRLRRSAIQIHVYRLPLQHINIFHSH